MSQIQVIGDKVAVALSALCVIHCFATPLLIIVLPSVASTFVDHDTFHELILFFVIPVGLVALAAGYRHHGKKSVFGWGLGGLFILTCAALLGHDYLSETQETLLTLFASVIIVTAHVKNFRLRQEPLSPSQHTHEK